MIPKKIHIIWVGDEAKRPHECIQSWKDNHPDYEVKVWGNEDYEQFSWRNQKHMERMRNWEMCGVADLMRWEILYNEGGIFVDADSTSIRPLSEWMHHCEALACYENEKLRPGLIATGFLGAIPGLPFFDQMIERFRRNPFLVERPSPLRRFRHPRAWKATGPGAFTKAIKRSKSHFTILPSSCFLPQHWSDKTDNSHPYTYARHFWGSTHGRY